MKPLQLCFYSGSWVDILIAAKNNYRLFINTEDPFPEHTAASLEDVHQSLLDAIGKFTKESKFPLYQGLLNHQLLGIHTGKWYQ